MNHPIGHPGAGEKRGRNGGRVLWSNPAAAKVAAGCAVRAPVVSECDVFRMLEDRGGGPYPVWFKLETEYTREGFCPFLPLAIEGQSAVPPMLGVCQVSSISYRDIAAAEDCEACGAELLGMGVEANYGVLCDAADHLPPFGARAENQQ